MSVTHYTETSPAYQAAKVYVDLGWRIIPLELRDSGGGKIRNHPVIKWKKEDMPTDRRLAKLLRDDSLSVAVQLGESSAGLDDTISLVDVDLDCPEARALAGYYLPETDAVFGRKGAPESHWIYYAPRAQARTRTWPAVGTGEKAMFIEARGGESHYTVFPGSTHHSGELVEWSGGGAPEEVPEPAYIKDVSILHRTCAEVAVGCLVLRSFDAGIKHNAFLALAGGLISTGWPLHRIEKLYQITAHVEGSEDPQNRLDTLQSTWAKWEELGEDAELAGWPTLEDIVGEDTVKLFVKYARQVVEEAELAAMLEALPLEPAEMVKQVEAASEAELVDLVERWAPEVYDFEDEGVRRVCAAMRARWMTVTEADEEAFKSSAVFKVIRGRQRELKEFEAETEATVTSAGLRRLSGAANKCPDRPEAIGAYIAKYTNHGERLRYHTEAKAWYALDDEAGVWRLGEFQSDPWMLKIWLDLLELVPRGKRFAGLTMDRLKAISAFTAAHGGAVFNDTKTGAGRFIPFRNGVWDLRERTFSSNLTVPGVFFTHRFPCAYDDWSHSTFIVPWLKNMFGEGPWLSVIRAVMASLLRGRLKGFEVLYELTGPAGAGKSTFMDLVKLLVGEEYTHTATMEDFGGARSRWLGASLAGKRLLLVRDAASYSKGSELLKAIVSGEEIPYEIKHKGMPGWVRSDATVFVGSNRIISHDDKTSGIDRRRLVIPVNARPSGARWLPRVEMAKRMREDLPGLVNWALGMEEDKIRYWLRDAREKNSTIRAQRDEARRESNHLAMWADQCLEEDPKGRIQIGSGDERLEDGERVFPTAHVHLYANYLRWVYRHKAVRTPISIVHFRSSLMDLLLFQLKFNVKHYKLDNKSTIKGLKFKDGAEPADKISEQFSAEIGENPW